MATNPDRARALRRRHQHERQAVVFGSLIAGLAVAALGAVAVYTDSIQPGFLDRSFVTPSAAPNGPVLPPPPCPPQGALPAAYGSVTVSVYNASSRNGLAGTTADVLAGRGFAIGTVADYPGSAPAVPVEVLFGETGIANAYTVAAQLIKPRLVLDTRQDASVDLVVGVDFAGMVPTDQVALDPTTPLVGVAGCVTLDDALPDAVPGPTQSPTGSSPSDGATPSDAATDGSNQG
ncbi:LytR C-terminal domain-containing protein [Isoptericola sp. b490]|uniref:LytR C-terminal domain-containing protein n=1 Tax=Actinotalea lenta TaxID=3064654 RepID=UPI002712C0F5|nr:LytR C-terminal domain-containing protein [Isoptericola sp. b490]MDO8121953.1 LytR C-terminal domain-containing protein [Isoptericola sp. b490]